PGPTSGHGGLRACRDCVFRLPLVIIKVDYASRSFARSKSMTRPALFVSLSFSVLTACASQPTAAPVAAAAPPQPLSTEQKCKEAANLREAGFKALNELKLAAAKRAYMKSLELDPGNKGALVQLDVIEALAEDRQIGASSDTNN